MQKKIKYGESFIWRWLILSLAHSVSLSERSEVCPPPPSMQVTRWAGRLSFLLDLNFEQFGNDSIRHYCIWLMGKPKIYHSWHSQISGNWILKQTMSAREVPWHVFLFHFGGVNVIQIFLETLPFLWQCTSPLLNSLRRTEQVNYLIIKYLWSNSVNEKWQLRSVEYTRKKNGRRLYIK